MSLKKNIDFLSKAPAAFALSVVLVVGSIYLWVSKGDDKYGTDYRGGTEVVARIQDAASSDVVRAGLEKQGLDGVTVQSFEIGSNEYSIRVSDVTEARAKIEGALKGAFAEKAEVLKVDVVGPTIGQELREKAIVAIFISLIVMLIYISVRFEFAFAAGAVVALFHDVIIATGGYLLAGHTLNAGTLAAALTITGYSVNDTIVIYDRIREEMMKREHFDLKDLINECMNVMLSRTIITSLLTFFSALALLVIGGGAIADLSLFLCIGLVSGVYSTIYIAAPVAIWIEKMRESRRAARATAT
jgi:preprotein translocase subunit SecF